MPKSSRCQHLNPYALFRETNPRVRRASSHKLEEAVRRADAIFTIVDIENMDSRSISLLMQPECLRAMRPGINGEPPLFTIADIVGMKSHVIRELVQPHYLQAMRFGINGEPPLFTITDIVKMINEAMSQPDYVDSLQILNDYFLKLSQAASMLVEALCNPEEIEESIQKSQNY